MKDPTFDPYRKWLGIPEESRPPTHYQLLGIQPTERDPDVIRAAVTQRSAYVRNFQAGKHADDATRLLNEIAAAEACVSNKEKRAAYDAELKRKQALKNPRPAPALPAAPRIDPLLEQAAAMTTMSAPWQSPQFGSGRAKQVNYLPLAIGGVAVVVVVVLGMVLASMLGGDDTPVAQVEPPAAGGDLPPENPPPAADQSASATDAASAQNPAATDTPAATVDADPAATASESSLPVDPPAVDPAADSSADPAPDSSSGHVAAEEPAEVPIEPPEISGVTADKVVIWNQHNGNAKDRGTAVCNVLLVRAGQVIWRKDAVQVPWSETRDTKVEVPIPSEPFDRVRVEVTKLTRNTSGGLAEIQVLRGETNLARGCPVVASGYWENNLQFRPELVVDGITTSAVINEGYWLMPDWILGWIEVDLALPRPADYTGLIAEKVVVWNQHNGAANDRGTREFDLVLLLENREVWRQKDVPIPWRPNEDTQAAIELPDIGFDRVRVEIDKYQGVGGGLAEVQVFRDGVNIALDAPAVAHSVFENRPEFAASRLTDGATNSVTLGDGYWISAERMPVWAEIDLVRHSPQLAEAARRLGEYRCFVEGDWVRGLPWLLRCDNAGLRNLAEAEQLDPSGPAELVSLGDAWWDLAEASPAAYRDKLRGRALWRYVRALPGLVEFSKPRIEKRIADSLPTLPERHYLHFMEDFDVQGIPAEYSLRHNVLVDGLPRPYGLWMYAPARGASQAKFRLDKRYRRLIGAAGIDDRALDRTATAQTFRVRGDGRELWKSKPLKKSAASEPFDLDVSGVEVLELVVDCPGPNTFSHAVWFEPRLEE